MKDDHSMFAATMLNATVRDREGWVNSRTNDLQRHLSGLKSYLMLFVEGHLDYHQLEEEAEKLTKRLKFVLDQARALQEARNDGHITRK